MQVATPTTSVSKTSLWIGRVLSALAALFLLFDGITHVVQISPVVDSLNQLGYPVNLALVLGVMELVCLAVYVFPATSVLGAILLTGYLGGAISAHLRLGDPLFSTTLFPVYIGILIWGGLYLRDERVRALFTARKEH
ncbi:DoxX family protein [Dictyobacter aurantiacus]|uniref:Membrane protein n=1 Tax=Dictyobacter aurantiacus TaxID=1936993 RepID=A0A401ZM95_9CHLR|nr:DoxX family protein [Dictyobacter aurantiacus]GCE07950.1 membrane protein [Dictyobacter aurantiacus]